MNEDIPFWTWINDTTLGIVTDSQVQHWNVINGESAPKKVSSILGIAADQMQIFDRHATLAGNQIINYRVSHDGQWCVVIGISSNQAPGGFKVKGAMQLYSIERGVSQPIEGHAAAFALFKQDGAANPSKLFIFAVRNANGAKVSLSTT